MRKTFLNSCALALMSYANSLTSLTNDPSHANEAAKTIESLISQKVDSSKVSINNVRIEAEDLPVQYLKGLTLNGCVLSGFNLDGIDLREINLEDTRFENCIVRSAIVTEKLTCQDVLRLKKTLPIELIKVYADLIIKDDINFYKYMLDVFPFTNLNSINYSNCYEDYKREYKYSKYNKAVDQFYHILKAIDCSDILEDFKKEIGKLLTDLIDKNNFLGLHETNTIFYIIIPKKYEYTLPYMQKINCENTGMSIDLFRPFYASKLISAQNIEQIYASILLSAQNFEQTHTYKLPTTKNIEQKYVSTLLSGQYFKQINMPKDYMFVLLEVRKIAIHHYLEQCTKHTNK